MNPKSGHRAVYRYMYDMDPNLKADSNKTDLSSTGGVVEFEGEKRSEENIAKPMTAEEAVAYLRSIFSEEDLRHRPRNHP